MNAFPLLVHAYRQAPWRIQRRWASAFLLGLVGLAMIAALYLDVTARAAILGREIQSLKADIARLRQENATLQTRLAELMSTYSMEQRARALGYRPVKSTEIHYVIVPGYVRPTSVKLVDTVARPATEALPPEYRQSLLEWFVEYFHSTYGGGDGVSLFTGGLP